jgi:PQQ enzyme repeat
VAGNWLLPGTLAVALLLFVMGAKVTHYSSAHPKPSDIIYALDADTGKALWASRTDRPDSWTAQYVGTSPVRTKLVNFIPDWLPFQFLQRNAPAAPLQPPQANVLENTLAGDVRTLRVHLTSPRHARVISVELPDNQIIDGWVQDQKLGQPSDSRWNTNGKWAFNYANLPSEGIDLRLQIKGTGAVKLVIIDHTIGLPAIPGANFLPRPADSMPYGGGDQTIVRRAFVF